MYTERTIRASLTIAFCGVYASAAPLVYGANLSGQWRMEEVWLPANVHFIVTNYNDSGAVTNVSEFDRISDKVSSEGFHYVTQNGEQIEGWSEWPGDSSCDGFLVQLDGTVSGNSVRFTITTTERNTHPVCHEHERTGVTCCTELGASYTLTYEGKYDPETNVISGTNATGQIHIFSDCWRYGPPNRTLHYSVEQINDISSTFTVTIGCSCDVGQWPIDLHDTSDLSTPHHQIYDLEADSGERIEVWWLGHYEAFYWRPGGPQGLRVGQCHWDDGCNRMWISAADLNGNDRPDCFSLIQWLSWDFGEDQDRDNRLDAVRYSYAPCLAFDDVYQLWTEYDYACGPPVWAKSGTCEPL